MATAAAQHQEACPWCGNQIERAKFVEIETRIRADEKRRFDVVEAEARATLAAEREVLETKYKADKTSLELNLQQTREQLAKAAEAQAEFDLRLKEATASAAEAERKKLEAELVEKHQLELARERELIKAEHVKEMVKHDAETQKATKALQKQLADVQRKLDDQSAQKAEVVDLDVLEALKAEYKSDRVLRLPKTDKTDSGGDVLIEVKYKNAVCGKILIDSRVRGNWQTLYATKLRTDMDEQKADHAILSTLFFPKGAGELHRHDDDVLLVHPRRVVELVGILRQALVRMFQTKLSNEQRTEKKLRLYDHITSDAFRRKLAETGKLTKEVTELDAQEVDEHQRVWKKRGIVMKKLHAVHGDLAADINEIIDGIDK